MAKPIKETPVLTGKDAAAFVKQMKVADNTRVDAKERARRNPAKSAVLSERFFPHLRESGVKKGETVSSLFEAKNSSNE